MKDYILSNIDILSSWVIWMAILISLFTLLICIPRFRKLLDLLTDHLLGISILVWMTGVVLYCLGEYSDELSFWSIAPRSIIYSFKMFLTGSELSRVHESLRQDNTYMILFSLTHFLAALISILFVMKMVGFRIKTTIDLQLKTFFSPLTNKTLNIFWGINEASFTLAEDIYAKEKDGTIIFINDNDIYDDPSSQKLGLKSLLDVMSLSKSEISRIEGMKALASNCHTDLSCIPDDIKDIFKYLKLKNIRKIIKHSYKVRIFLLSDDEMSNINSALNLLKDISLSEHEDTTIYIHTFINRLNDIYNHYPLYSSNETDIKLQIIDTSYISVSLLKMEPEHHPVNLTDIDMETATVRSPMETLIIGFGETGQEAFRFLYEFGSFVGQDGNKVPFRCTAIDRKMQTIAGSVINSMPAITEDELILSNVSLESFEYWALMKEIILKLNYVVITINDDDTSMVTAMELYKYALKERNGRLKNFRIYVRCYKWQNFRRMKDLANKMNKANAGSDGQIIIFGNITELYSYDIIIRNRIMQEAMRFNKAYEKSEDTPEKVWKDIFGEKSINEKLDKYPAYTRMQLIDDINRRISQNISNSFHRHTKAAILRVCLRHVSTKEALKEITASRKSGSTIYTKADKSIQACLTNLAICEHIRWESSHKLLGYTYASEKNLVSKHHDCLLPWKDLDETTRAYDCDVVDTGIEMMS